MRVERDHAVQRRSGAVEGCDAGLVGAHQLLGSDLAGGHVGLQLRDRPFHHVVPRRRRACRPANQHQRQPDPADSLHSDPRRAMARASHAPAAAAVRK
jgi:hypothetical protein